MASAAEISNWLGVALGMASVWFVGRNTSSTAEIRRGIGLEDFAPWAQACSGHKDCSSLGKAKKKHAEDKEYCLLGLALGLTRSGSAWLVHYQRAATDAPTKTEVVNLYYFFG